MAITSLDAIKIYKKKTALVIDDYPDMRGSIRRMLDSFGIIRCDTASNGEEAILKCEKNTYDVILADYNLGENKNGQQVLEELRYKNLLKNTAIYMMITAETTKDVVFGAFEYQADDYLTKPFTQGVLQKRLDRMVMEKNACFLSTTRWITTTLIAPLLCASKELISMTYMSSVVIASWPAVFTKKLNILALKIFIPASLKNKARVDNY